MNLLTLQQEIAREISQSGANVSVFAQNLQAETPFISVAPDKRMAAADTIHLLILIATLRKVQQNRLTLDTKILVQQQDILEDTEVFLFGERAYTVQELLAWMLLKAEGTAANVLIDKLGLTAINAETERMQLAQTTLMCKMEDREATAAGRNNYTCATDLYKIYSALYGGDLLPQPLTQLALAMLRAQRDCGIFKRYIWQNVPLAHSTGRQTYLSHDAGV
ncbi:MAG: serine hydrolase, partial [Ruthenibacterium sp.]